MDIYTNPLLPKTQHIRYRAPNTSAHALTLDNKISHQSQELFLPLFPECPVGKLVG